MKYAVVDVAGTLDPATLTAYAAAQQRQLREHYATCYDGDGIDDEVRVTTAGAPLADDEVSINLYETTPTDAPDGAEAIHRLTSNGMPACDVYLDLIQQAGEGLWTIAASHEVLESRTDPRLHACVELDDGTIWDREICDRVESESYTIDGVPLTNFNTPQCFEPSGEAGERYDWLRLSTQPNEVREGGYAQEFMPGQGWTQHGEKSAYRTALDKRGLSRGAKRKARSV